MMCITVLSGLILLGLSIYAFRYSYLFPVEYLELATPQKDSVWKLTAGAVFLCLLFLLVSYWVRQLSCKKQKLLQAGAVLLFVLAALIFCRMGQFTRREEIRDISVTVRRNS